MYNARKMKEIPEENRPYEKCLKFGVEALTDEELLAILLRSGSKEHSALELAYQVLHLSKENQGLQSKCTAVEKHSWNWRSKSHSIKVYGRNFQEDCSKCCSEGNLI